MKRIEFWHPTANGLWEPHSFIPRAWQPVAGKEAEAQAWFDVQNADLIAYKARLEDRKRARIARLTDGPAAVLRALAVGETRALSQYKHPAQVSATMSRIGALEDRTFSSWRDVALGCVMVRRNS